MAIAAGDIKILVATANQWEEYKQSVFSAWTSRRLKLLMEASASRFDGDDLPELASFCSWIVADKKIVTITSLLEDESDSWGGTLLLYGVSQLVNKGLRAKTICNSITASPDLEESHLVPVEHPFPGVPFGESIDPAVGVLVELTSHKDCSFYDIINLFLEAKGQENL